jgi:hypothetical protein
VIDEGFTGDDNLYRRSKFTVGDKGTKTMQSARLSISAFLVIVCCVTIDTSLARDAARDLRRMIGYTIVDTTTVSEVVDRGLEGKLLVLGNGTAFKVDMFLFDPLPLTDVIVFMKKFGKQDLILVKLLVENEVFDATQVK